MTSLLVVTPGFHGYGASVADAFARNGFQVSVHQYDVERSVGRKVWNKVAHELPAKVRGTHGHQSARRVSRVAADRVREVRPDLVLVIRGDVLEEDFWDTATADGRRVGVWLYDELRRMTFDPAAISQVARLATYSRLDAQELTASGVQTLHVRTGFDERRPVAPSSEAAGLVSFIGAPLPARESALRGLLGAGVPVRAWGRGWSDHPVDRARTWRLRGRGVPNQRDIPMDQALAVMRDSAATLNIHGDQDGFTMRTYESCGVGGVQLVDRADVAQLYEPGREVLVFSDQNELIELSRRVVANPGDFTEMRRRAQQRTLAEHTLVRRARELEALWE